MASTRQRGKGEGSIYFESATGRWRGAVVLPDGSRRRVSARTRKACREQLRAIQDDLEREAACPSLSLTVGEYLSRWSEEVLPARARVRSTNTVDNYRWAVEKHLIPALGEKRLQALTPEDVEALLRRLAKAGRAKNTIMRVRAVLVLALTHAERRSLVTRNVARLTEMPAGARPTAEGRSLTVAQAQRLLETVRGDRWEALLVVGLMLGLRPGELCGLLWEDVDLERGALQVRRSLKRERSGLRLGDPKTRQSFRGLDLPAPAVSALCAQAARREGVSQST